MTSNTPAQISPSPLYSPRNPMLRALIISFVAGFVACHKVFAYLWNATTPSASLASEDETGAGLSHETVR